MPNIVINTEYVSSPCRLRTMDNSLISTGRITQIDDEYVVIRMIPELRSVIPYNENVKLTILNDKLGHRSLIATVYASTTTIAKLYDIKEVDDFEKRVYYRINVSIKGQVAALGFGQQPSPSVDGDEKGEKDENKIDVRIKNISLSGVLFSGPVLLNIGDRLSIDIYTPMGKLSLTAVVKRMAKPEDGGDCDYGCEFEPYPDRVEDALWKYMMQKELENIRRARGEWSVRENKS